MTRIFLLMGLLGVASLSAFAEEIVTPQTFYERAISEAEKKQCVVKEITHFQKEDIGEIFETFKNRKWGREVVKVELLRAPKKDAAPEIQKLPGVAGQKEGTPFIHIAYLSEMLYTGKINEETQSQHVLKVTRVEVDRGATIDDVRNEFAQKKWSPSIVNVELLYGGMDVLAPYIRPYIQVTQLGESKQAQTERNAARDVFRKTYAIGKDVPGYKYRGCGFNPEMVETFECADKRKVEIFQIDSAQGEHDLVRRGMEYDSEIAGMKFGSVVASTMTVVLDGKSRVQSRLSWLSAPNHLISITAIRTDDSDPAKEFAEQLGEKYPSTLKTDFKIDKTQWARDETAAQIAQMDQALKSSGDFLESYELLNKTVRLPAWVIFRNEFDLNFQKRMHDDIASWWSANAEKCVWDGTLQRLMQR